MGERFFFRFQIVSSHNNNHLTAPCGLAAASDVKRREREGGERLMRLDNDQRPLDSYQSRTLQRNTLMDLPSVPALPYRSVTECAHSVAAHTPMHSISL